MVAMLLLIDLSNLSASEGLAAMVSSMKSAAPFRADSALVAASKMPGALMLAAGLPERYK